MKTDKRKKIMGLAFMVFFVSMVMLPITAEARSVINVEDGFKRTIVLSEEDEKNGYYVGTVNVPRKAKKMKVVTSKKSVARIGKCENGLLCIYPKKTGTTKLIVSAIVGKKKIKQQGTIKVVKFQNPFRVLKINGKSYLSKVKGSGNYIQFKKSKIRLNYKLKPGWKIFATYVEGFKPDTVKNNTTYTLKELSGYIAICAKNKKSREEVSVVAEVDLKEE